MWLSSELWILWQRVVLSPAGTQCSAFLLNWSRQTRLLGFITIGSNDECEYVWKFSFFSNDILAHAYPFNWLPWNRHKMLDSTTAHARWKKKIEVEKPQAQMHWNSRVTQFSYFIISQLLSEKTSPSCFIFGLAIFWILFYPVYFAFLSLFKSTGLEERGSGTGSDTISPHPRLHCHSSDIYKLDF